MHQTKWPQNIKAKTAKILRIKGQMHIILLFITMMQIVVGRIRQGKDMRQELKGRVKNSMISNCEKL